MEPRPPRPRGGGPLDLSGRTPAPAGNAYPTAGPPGYGPDPAYPYGGEIPLVPRQERRRRRLARVAGLLLLALLAVGAVGAAVPGVRDRFLGDDGEESIANRLPGSPTALVEPATTATGPTAPTGGVPGTTAATRPAAGRSSVLATETPVPAATLETADSEAEETPRPRVRPTVERTVTDEEAADAAEEEPAAASSLEELLPTDADLPQGLVLGEQSERSDEQLAADVGTEEIAQLLVEWGWRQNVMIEATVPEEGALAQTGTTALTASLHQFDSAEGAAAALVYFSDLLIASGSTDVAADPIGDETRVVQAATEEGLNVAAYVTDGATLFRIGGFSATGDPTPNVLALAETLVAK